MSKIPAQALASLFSLLIPLSAQGPTTTTLEGRVIDMRGEPVPAAELRVTSHESRDAVLARGRSDGEGFFRIDRVPERGDLRISVHASGRAVSWRPVFGAGPSTVRAQDGALLRGRLRNGAGEPVTDAVVKGDQVSRSGFGVRVEAVTDDEGRFELRGVALGNVRLQAVVPGEGLYVHVQRIVGDCEVELSPYDGPTTSLRVIVEGVPADAIGDLGTILLPYVGGRAYLFSRPWDRPSYDADARWTLTGVPDYDYLIRPRLRSFAMEPAGTFVRAGDGPHVLRFKATPPDRAQWRYRFAVRDAEGKPVPDVAIEMRDPNESFDMLDPDRGRRTLASTDEAGAAVISSSLARGHWAVVWSMDERWVIDPPQSKGRHRAPLMVIAPTRHPFRCDPEATVELRVIPACSVSGRLLLPDGRPAAFTELFLQAESLSPVPPRQNPEWRWGTVRGATTDRDGSYTIPRCRPFRRLLRLSARSHNGSLASEPFALVEAGTHVALPDLRLSPPSIIEGTVLDPAGSPAPGVHVWLRDWDLAQSRQRGGNVLEVITDRQGRYRFLGVSPGGACLALLGEDPLPRGAAAEPFEVEPGKTYSFELELTTK